MEVVTKQVSLQANRPEPQLANINAVKWKNGQYGKKSHDNMRQGDSSQGAYTKEECGRCGKPQHSDEKRCPALKSKCNKCHKNGHREHKCQSKAVREVTSEQPEQTYFLGAVDHENGENKWTVS